MTRDIHRELEQAHAFKEIIGRRFDEAIAADHPSQIQLGQDWLEAYLAVATLREEIDQMDMLTSKESV